MSEPGLLLLIRNEQSEDVIRGYIEKHPEEINCVDEIADTALIIIAGMSETYRTANILRLLVNAGAELNWQNCVGHTALMRVCTHTPRINDYRTQTILGHAGLDVTDATTLLVVETMLEDSREKMKILIDAGADPTIYDHDNYNAFAFCFDLEYLTKCIRDKAVIDEAKKSFHRTILKKIKP